MKLGLRPQAAAYEVAPGNTVAEVKLDGGRSRRRRDILNASSVVAVTWRLNREEYDYFWAFYRTVLVDGSLPFEIDLVLERVGIREVTASFVSGSVRDSDHQGDTYLIVAEIEVDSIDRDSTADNATVTAYHAKYGIT